VEEVFPQERFASGKKNNRGAEPGQVLDERPSFFPGQFSGVFPVLGMGIAVDAFQVASLPYVPHHHRFLIFRKLEEVGREFLGMPPVTQGVRGFHRSAVQFRNPDHGKIA
jgi:hypothetical protein